VEQYIRRYARLSDVSVNDVLFVDNDTKSKMKDGITALLESSVKKSIPDVKKAVSVPIDKFIAIYYQLLNQSKLL
jgi:hypothetical protein